MIRFHIDSIFLYRMIFKLERLFYLSYRSFRLSSLIGLEAPRIEMSEISADISPIFHVSGVNETIFDK